MPSPVIIPHLPALLVQSGSCVAFKPDDGLILDWARANEGVFRALVDADCDPLCVDLVVDVSHDGRVHFHIERGRKEFEDVDAEHRNYDFLVTKITEFVDLAGDKPHCIRTSAVLASPDSQLPENGMICRLLRTHGSACGVPFTLTRGYLDLKDDLYTRIVFSRNSETGLVLITLSYQSDDCLRHEFLVEADRLAKTGADCFVFERITPEVSNVQELL